MSSLVASFFERHGNVLEPRRPPFGHIEPQRGGVLQPRATPWLRKRCDDKARKVGITLDAVSLMSLLQGGRAKALPWAFLVRAVGAPEYDHVHDHQCSHQPCPRH